MTELLVGAIAVALGTNILATEISEALSTPRAVALGLFLVGVSAVYLFTKLWRATQLSLRVPAFILASGRPRLVLGISGYEFPNMMQELLKMAHTENSALKAQWEHSIQPEETDGVIRSPEYPNQERMIREVAEFMLLEKLSEHLRWYFADLPQDDERLTSVSRQDLPGSVLSNPFLELFSQSPANRPAFSDGSGYEDTLWIKSADGYYSRFELRLPRGSQLARSTDRGLVIDSPAVRCELAIGEIEGGSIPYAVINYLGERGGGSTTSCLEIPIFLNVTFKLRSILFSAKNRSFIRWAESFAEVLTAEWSFDVFVENCQPQAALTVVEGRRRYP